MSKQSVIAGEYILQIEDNGHVDVVRIPRNAKATMINISEKKGFKYDKKWNTRYFGYALCKEYGDSWTATFDDITIIRQKNNKIDIVQDCKPVKKALKEICDQMGFEYDYNWNTQYFGWKVVNYLTTKKDNADKILQTPNMKKCAERASAILESPQVLDVEKRDPSNWTRTKENGKYGYKDEDGNIVIPFQYDYVGYIWENGFCCVEIEGKKGYINSTGDVIVPIEYSFVNFWKEGNCFLVGQGDMGDCKYGAMSIEGKIILPLEYEDANTNWVEDKCLLRKEGVSYILGKGGVIEKFPYDHHEQFDYDTDLSLVRRDGKWGYVNRALEEVVPCENQYCVLCVECNPYILESMPMDNETLKESFASLKEEYEEEFNEYGISKAKKMSKDNVGDLLAISERGMFCEYGSECHCYIDDVEKITICHVNGKDWWNEWCSIEHDDDVEFDPEEVNVEYSDYPIDENCIEVIYKRAPYACGLFYRLIIKNIEEFDPSKLKIVSSDTDVPNVFYGETPLMNLGDGFNEYEFEYNTARLFWDGVEIDLPEK